MSVKTVKKILSDVLNELERTMKLLEESKEELLTYYDLKSAGFVIVKKSEILKVIKQLINKYKREYEKLSKTCNELSAVLDLNSDVKVVILPLWFPKYSES